MKMFSIYKTALRTKSQNLAIKPPPRRGFGGGSDLHTAPKAAGNSGGVQKSGTKLETVSFYHYLCIHGFQTRIGLCPDGRPAGGDRATGELDRTRLEAQHAAGRDGLREDLHGGQRHRAAEPSDAGAEP